VIEIVFILKVGGFFTYGGGAALIFGFGD